MFQNLYLFQHPLTYSPSSRWYFAGNIFITELFSAAESESTIIVTTALKRQLYWTILRLKCLPKLLNSPFYRRDTPQDSCLIYQIPRLNTTGVNQLQPQSQNFVTRYGLYVRENGNLRDMMEIFRREGYSADWSTASGRISSPLELSRSVKKDIMHFVGKWVLLLILSKNKLVG